MVIDILFISTIITLWCCVVWLLRQVQKGVHHEVRRRFEEMEAAISRRETASAAFEKAYQDATPKDRAKLEIAWKEWWSLQKSDMSYDHVPYMQFLEKEALIFEDILESIAKDCESITK